MFFRRSQSGEGGRRGGASRNAMLWHGIVFERSVMISVCNCVVCCTVLCLPEFVYRALFVRVVMMA